MLDDILILSAISASLNSGPQESEEVSCASLPLCKRFNG
jgi:hypothetical protein